MSGMRVSAVVAASDNGVIGRDGGLPWHVSSDLKLFKEITLGKPVIMGRRTWESLPRQPLPSPAWRAASGADSIARMSNTTLAAPGRRLDCDNSVEVQRIMVSELRLSARATSFLALAPRLSSCLLGEP